MAKEMEGRSVVPCLTWLCWNENDLNGERQSCRSNVGVHNCGSLLARLFMVKEAQLEAISLFAFQRARLSNSVIISVKGASFWLDSCLAFSSRVLVKLMIGWLEHIFVWFFNFLLADRIIWSCHFLEMAYLGLSCRFWYRFSFSV
jgi:hypothetical protein